MKFKAYYERECGRFRIGDVVAESSVEALHQLRSGSFALVPFGVRPPSDEARRERVHAKGRAAFFAVGKRQNRKPWRSRQAP